MTANHGTPKVDEVALCIIDTCTIAYKITRFEPWHTVKVLMIRVSGLVSLVKRFEHWPCNTRKRKARPDSRKPAQPSPCDGFRGPEARLKDSASLRPDEPSLQAQAFSTCGNDHATTVQSCSYY